MQKKKGKQKANQQNPKNTKAKSKGKKRGKKGKSKRVKKKNRCLHLLCFFDLFFVLLCFGSFLFFPGKKRNSFCFRFFSFEVLLFDFPCVFLFLACFSSLKVLKIIRISYWGEHKDRPSFHKLPVEFSPSCVEPKHMLSNSFLLTEMENTHWPKCWNFECLSIWRAKHWICGWSSDCRIGKVCKNMRAHFCATNMASHVSVKLKVRRGSFLYLHQYRHYAHHGLSWHGMANVFVCPLWSQSLEV